MKKLLVLSLVLAVAGLANAALSMTYDGAVISVSSDEGMIGGINAGLGIIGPAVVNGDLVLRAAGPAATPAITVYSGVDALSFGLPYDGGFNNLTWGTADPVLAEPAGFWFSMPLAGFVQVETGPIQVDLIDGFGTPLQTMFLAAVPEPMTMGLLALGALFIRKR